MEEKPINYCLPKSERIYLKESIKEVFAEGKSFVAYPLRVIYIIDQEQPRQGAIKGKTARSQMMISVPKKYFKRAVDRNRVKRLVRENYRLNKHKLIVELDERDLYARIIFINVARDLPSFKQCKKGVNKAFERIISELSNEVSE